ncbi:MAG: RNA degradosome polyphosphate kinase, partial [Verrucomicrobiota bacterium]
MKITSDHFMNRELSWLEFNQRVLDEARDRDVPMLERLKFLAITASNLDEFFQVRVGGLHLLVQQENRKKDAAGITPSQQLTAISRRTHNMVNEQYLCLIDELEPGLEAGGIRRVPLDELNAHQTDYLKTHFDDEIFPVLTPMAVSSREDFPLLVNQWTYILARLNPVGDEEQPRFAIIPLGRHMNRFIALPAQSGFNYLLLEDLVALHIEAFFLGEEVRECVPFRITRNADLSLEDDLQSDLLVGMEDILAERKRSDCVRLEISDTAGSETLDFLRSTLKLDANDVYCTSGPVDLSSYMELASIDGYDELKYEPWQPQRSPMIENPTESMFKTLLEKDVLFCHPYESFEPVVRFLEEAAADPDVLAIKQILYRASKQSAIMQALKTAARSGKSVT